MKTFRVLFYKSKIGDGHWIDNAISLWTKLWNWNTKNYSHVEIWTPQYDDNTLWGTTYENNKKSYWGTCWTSTMRYTGKDKKINGVKGGCVKRDASLVLKHPERWDYCEITVDDKDYDRAYKWGEKRVKNNKGYDKKMLLRFFLPKWLFNKLGLNDPDKDICSEFGEQWIFWAAVFNMLIGWSPRRLSKRIEQKGYEIRSLV